MNKNNNVGKWRAISRQDKAEECFCIACINWNLKIVHVYKYELNPLTYGLKFATIKMSKGVVHYPLG